MAPIQITRRGVCVYKRLLNNGLHELALGMARPKKNLRNKPILPPLKPGQTSDNGWRGERCSSRG